ncbi:LytR family transcriptional regulator [Streptomyces sp. Ru62]|uniref:LCP family protein n=1 Tax=Streptomyces sp. Ru62 TaxID=2080745 RepID=UPI000CDD5124|nr:LytR family transcriptional regulator [Streptomyces sp. Ru62]
MPSSQHTELRADRRRPRPIRARGTTLLILAAVAALALHAVQLRIDRSIQMFDADGLSPHRPAAGHLTGQNVLLIGSDARNRGNNALGGGNGADTGRADTTILLHVYADQRHALAVSLPRDTLVTIPPCRLPDGVWSRARTGAMLNSAFSVGGSPTGNPACTQNTVEALTGLRVDHTVVIDFRGFAALTDAVGGVRVCSPADVYQRDLDPNRSTRGALVFHKGEQTVSGRKALDYVRLRHGLGDGSDIGRVQRQQAFVAALVRKIRARGLSPARLLPLARTVARSAIVDPGLGSARKLLAFARSLSGIHPHDTRFVTVPWRYAGERVALVQPDADRLWAALRADRTAAQPSGASPAPSAAPVLPPSVRATARPADATPCAHLSFGRS